MDNNKYWRNAWRPFFQRGTTTRRSKSRHTDVFSPRLERLEQRQLLAADIDWAAALGNGSQGTGRATAADLSGNVFVAGSFSGVVDFDPGLGTTELSSSGVSDVYVAKYTATGELAWVSQFIGQAEPSGIAVDSAGNVVLTGTFQNELAITSNESLPHLTSQGSSDVFLIKLNASGTPIWADQFGNESTDYGTSVAVAANGNIVLVGSFQGTVDFDPSPNVAELSSGRVSQFSPSSYDAFVVTLNPNGNYLRAGQLGGLTGSSGFDASGDQYATGVAIDSQGNIAVSGYFSGKSDFDPGTNTTVLTSAGGYDAFVAKLNSVGDYLWAKQFGSTSEDRANSLAIDPSGKMNVTGYFLGTVDFDPSAATDLLLSSSGYDAFLFQLDGSGNTQWARAFGGDAGDEGLSVAVDGSGNISLLGSFTNDVDFDPDAGIAQLASTAGSSDTFISHYNSSGQFLWANSIGNANVETASAVAIDGLGNTIVIGEFVGQLDFDTGSGTANRNSGTQSNAYFAKWNATGQFVSALVPFVGATGESRSSVVDGNGNVYVTGHWSGVADFDPGTGTAWLASAGLNDAYVAKFSPVGDLLWVKQFGGTGLDLGADIVLDSLGNVILTGYFSNTVDFDPGPGDAPLTATQGPNSYSNTFVLKLDSNGNYVWAKQFTGIDQNNNFSYGLAVDSLNNIVITGVFGGTVDFDPSGAVFSLTSEITAPTYVVKLDSNGGLVWAKQLGGESRSITVDAAGHVLVGGAFQYSTADFDPGAGVALLQNHSVQSFQTDPFLAKLNAAGEFQWAINPGGGGTDGIYDVTTDQSGAVIVTGFFANTVDFDTGPNSALLTSFGPSNGFLAKYNPDGDYVWAKRFGGIGSSVAVDASGDIVVAGVFRDSADFNDEETYLFSYGQSDIFVKKVDSDGNHLWLAQLGGASYDNATRVTVDNSDQVWITGSFANRADIDPAPGSEFTLQGAQPAGFIAKLHQSSDPVGEVPIANPDSLAGAPNQMLSFVSSDLLANDVVAIGSTVTVELVSQPAHGSLVDFLNGTFAYVPDSGYTGSDSFTYRLKVGSQFSNFATVEIDISSQNHAPTGLSLSNDTFEENVFVGVNIATLLPQDPDGNDTFSFQFVGGAGSEDNGRFLINGNHLATNDVFDFESKQTYTIRIQVTDAEGLSAEQSFTLQITDLNEAPTAIQVSALQVEEQLPAGTLVGLLTAVDPDAGDASTFSLVSGPNSAGNSAFQIVGNELRTSASFDFSTQSVYSIRIRATDTQSAILDQVFSVDVLNVVGPPVVNLAQSPLTVKSRKVSVIDSSATLSDSDATSYAGGSLRIRIASGGVSTDRLGLKSGKTNQGVTLKLTKRGTVLKLGRQVVGTASGGSNGSPLVFQFQAGATRSLVATLLRNLTFRGMSSGDRVLEIEIESSTGFTSEPESRTIHVG